MSLVFSPPSVLYWRKSPQGGSAYVRYHRRHRHAPAAQRHRYPAPVRAGYADRAGPGIPRQKRPFRRGADAAPHGVRRPAGRGRQRHRQRAVRPVPRPGQLYRRGLCRAALSRLAGGAERRSCRAVRRRMPAGQGRRVHPPRLPQRADGSHSGGVRGRPHRRGDGRGGEKRGVPAGRRPEPCHRPHLRRLDGHGGAVLRRGGLPRRGHRGRAAPAAAGHAAYLPAGAGDAAGHLLPRTASAAGRPHRYSGAAQRGEVLPAQRPAGL